MMTVKDNLIYIISTLFEEPEAYQAFQDDADITKFFNNKSSITQYDMLKAIYNAVAKYHSRPLADYIMFWKLLSKQIDINNQKQWLDFIETSSLPKTLRELPQDHFLYNLLHTVSIMEERALMYALRNSNKNTN